MMPEFQRAESEADLSDPPIRDAATIILVREGTDGVEVLTVRRARDAAFAPGAYVFPGGRVDDADGEIPVTGRDSDECSRLVGSDLGAAFWGAAARETFEESGVLIATTASGETPAVDIAVERRRVHSGERRFADLLADVSAGVDAGRIAFVARWITPRGEARRFDTRFFLAMGPDGAEAVHDDHETTAAHWVRPAELLASAGRGEVFILPPTMANLSWLAGFDSVDAALEAGFARSVDVVAPKIIFGDDGEISIEFEGGEPPVVVRPARNVSDP